MLKSTGFGFLRRITLALVAAALLSGITASAGRAEPEDDIEAAFDGLVQAWNDEDVAAFMGHFTDEGLAYQFYGLTGDEAAEAIAGDRMELGPIVSSSISGIQVAGDDASAEVELEFEVGFLLYEEWEFHLVDGAWAAGAGAPLFRPILAGVTAITMTLQEYAFVYDQSAVSSGNFGFEVMNAGAEEHEVLFLSLGASSSLSDVVDSIVETDEPPAGVEFVHFGGIFQPGVEGTVVLPGPLDAGRYALLCFLPAPDGTPHAVLGMASEFAVGDPHVTSPSAGEAGLAAPGGSKGNDLLLPGVGLLAGVVILAVLARMKFGAG